MREFSMSGMKWSGHESIPEYLVSKSRAKHYQGSLVAKIK